MYPFTGYLGNPSGSRRRRYPNPSQYFPNWGHPASRGEIREQGVVSAVWLRNLPHKAGCPVDVSRRACLAIRQITLLENSGQKCGEPCTRNVCVYFEAAAFAAVSLTRMALTGQISTHAKHCSQGRGSEKRPSENRIIVSKPRLAKATRGTS